MNKNLLIAAWVLTLGGEDVIMQILKQIIQMTITNPSAEAMQVWYIVVMIIQLVLMLATVVFSLLALRDKSLKLMASISAISGGLKLFFAVLALVIGFFTNSQALS